MNSGKFNSFIGSSEWENVSRNETIARVSLGCMLAVIPLVATNPLPIWVLYIASAYLFTTGLVAWDPFYAVLRLRSRNILFDQSDIDSEEITPIIITRFAKQKARSAEMNQRSAA
jgi:hypothetical protein